MSNNQTPGNQAAWVDGKDKKLRVDSGEMPTPKPDEVIIRNFAVAVNPVDCEYDPCC